MATHVKILAVVYIALSALFVLGAILLMLTLGGAAGIVGVAADPGDAALAIPIMGFAGSVAVVILMILGLPGLIGGWGLLNYRPWARILVIVLSALNILNFPIGTVLGAYGLWVLLSKETEPLFAQPRPTL
jgi:hypothetical protein